MVRLLEETFDSIPRTDEGTATACRLKDMLGFDDLVELEGFLKSRDWYLEDGFWIPGEWYLCDGGVVESPTVVAPLNGGEDLGFGLLDVGTDSEKDGGKSPSWKEEKIHFLTNVVGFMERQGLDMTASREGGK